MLLHLKYGRWTGFTGLSVMEHLSGLLLASGVSVHLVDPVSVVIKPDRRPLASILNLQHHRVFLQRPAVPFDVDADVDIEIEVERLHPIKLRPSRSAGVTEVVCVIKSDERTLAHRTVLALATSSETLQSSAWYGSASSKSVSGNTLLASRAAAESREQRAAERPPSVFCLGELALAGNRSRERPPCLRVTEALWLPSL